MFHPDHKSRQIQKLSFVRIVFYSFILFIFAVVKKIAAILLCLLFLFNIMGYYAAFIIHRSQLKREMKAFIRSDAGIKSAQKLYIPYDQFESSVNFIEEHEFIYRNEMYDLVKKESTSTGIILYCINDKKEKLLLESTKENVSRNHEQNNSTNRSISVVKNIIKEACPENISCHYHPVISQKNYFESSFGLYSTFLPVDSPPPKSV